MALSRRLMWNSATLPCCGPEPDAGRHCVAVGGGDWAARSCRLFAVSFGVKAQGPLVERRDHAIAERRALPGEQQMCEKEGRTSRGRGGAASRVGAGKGRDAMEQTRRQVARQGASGRLMQSYVREPALHRWRSVPWLRPDNFLCRACPAPVEEHAPGAIAGSTPPNLPCGGGGARRSAGQTGAAVPGKGLGVQGARDIAAEWGLQGFSGFGGPGPEQLQR